MVIAMLDICPSRRMVATVPDAMPKYRRSTALIMAFMLGDENREKPNPRNASVKTIKTLDVPAPIKTKENSPMAVIIIPAEAIRRGSILSESLPASGEKTAITIGWAMRIDPAYWGGMFLIYCR